MFGLFKKKRAEPIETTPDHATLYISDPSLLGSKTFDTISGILSYQGASDEGGNATGLRRLKAGELIMNFMPKQMIAEHLEGMSGYVEQNIRNRDKLPYVLSRITEVWFVIGCVAPQGFGKDGEMIETLLELNAALNGLFFMGDSLFDYDAQPVAGSACDG